MAAHAAIAVALRRADSALLPHAALVCQGWRAVAEAELRARRADLSCGVEAHGVPCVNDRCGVGLRLQEFVPLQANPTVAQGQRCAHWMQLRSRQRLAAWQHDGRVRGLLLRA